MRQNTLVVAIISGAVCFVIGFGGGALLTKPNREKTKSTIAALEAKADKAQKIAEQKIQIAKAEAASLENKLRLVTTALKQAKKDLQIAKAEAASSENKLKLVATTPKETKKDSKGVTHELEQAKYEIKATNTKNTDILGYKIVSRQDISYAGTPRMVFRVVIKAEAIPSEDQLKKIATRIWEDGNKSWKEFTTFMYLPGMNTESAAYGIGEFRPYGIKELLINDYALYGTRWWNSYAKEEKKKTDEEWKRQKQRPEVKEYYINLNVEKLNGRRIKANVQTNFPNGTNLHISVYRTFNEKGKSEKCAGDVFSKDMSVEDGKIDLAIDINDSHWYNEYHQNAEKFRRFVDFPGIGEISPYLEVSVLLSPKRDQPKNVLRILGTDGEFIKGAGAERTGRAGNFFTTYSVSKTVNIPFKK